MKPSLKARGTLKDVAKTVGVSHTTVSNAFNRPDQLSSDLRERILAAARSMSYPGPNPAARMLRTGFARTIAVVWTDPMPHAFEDQAAAAFLAGVAEACAERDLGLLLVQGGESSFRSIQGAAIDGLIIYSIPGNDGTLRIVSDRALPTVIVDQPLIPGVPFVGIDNRAASRICAQHLKALGHKRFGIASLRLGTDRYRGFVEPERLESACSELSRHRVDGYLDILGENGPNGEVRIWECPCSVEKEGTMAGEIPGPPPAPNRDSGGERPAGDRPHRGGAKTWPSHSGRSFCRRFRRHPSLRDDHAATYHGQPASEGEGTFGNFSAAG